MINSLKLVAKGTVMYKRSKDYVLADKLLRASGEPLAAWLTDANDITTFHLLSYGNDGLCVDGVFQPRIQFQTNFFDYCEVTHAQFLLPVLEDDTPKVDDRDRQREELQISLRNHHEQFADLKASTEVVYKAITMMLESLKGDRKPDEVKAVDGVMVTFRNYDDNLTHHHKTIIIGNIQRVIANESRKLGGRSLADFSFDGQPF